jgi:uncharacterized protein YegJ (DUF2314 family)
VPTLDADALQGHDGPQVERMSVRITGYSETGYVGVLNNDPRTTGAPGSMAH